MKQTFSFLTIALSLLLQTATQNLFSLDSQVEELMREKISNLEQGSSFTYVDLGLSNEDLSLLDRFQFDKMPPGDQTSYNRFGNLHLLKEELPAFLKDIGNNDEEANQVVTEIISRIVNNVTKASGKNSAWVSIRFFTPPDESYIPRWHLDGSYYGPYPYPGLVFKFAAVLKGPGTLLFSLENDMRSIFIANEENRLFLSELLDIHKAESAKRGQGIFFIVGDEELGAVHSEPEITEDRLFFSVLVGDQAEIEELYLRWYPN